MKIKIIALTAMLTLTAGSAFAVTTFSDTASSTLGTPAVTVKVSKNVSVTYTPEAAGLTYTMTSYHSSGTKTFGSSSGDTKIFMMDGTNQTCPAAPAAGATAAFGTGWTAM